MKVSDFKKEVVMHVVTEPESGMRILTLLHHPSGQVAMLTLPASKKTINDYISTLYVKAIQINKKELSDEK